MIAIGVVGGEQTRKCGQMLPGSAILVGWKAASGVKVRPRNLMMPKFPKSRMPPRNS